MLKSATMLKYMADLDKILLEWLDKHPSLAAVFPANCDVMFVRAEENALRILATALYVGRVSNCPVPGEALNTRQTNPDFVICRELVPPTGESMRYTLLYPDGESDVFLLDTDESRYAYFQYISELLSPE